MNKKILLALLGLALGSCGGTPTSSSNPPAGSSDTQSTPASDSSPAPSSSDSSVTPSSSDSGVTPSSSDSGSGGGSSSSGGESSGGESSGGDSSGTSGSGGGGGTVTPDTPTMTKKEQIMAFLTAKDSGLANGRFSVTTKIVSPVQFAQDNPDTADVDESVYAQYLLSGSLMKATYAAAGEKAMRKLEAEYTYFIQEGKAVEAYEEMKANLPAEYLVPVPDGVDVTTQEGALLYFKAFIAASSVTPRDISDIGERLEDGYHVFYVVNGNQTLELRYFDQKADHVEFYNLNPYMNNPTIYKGTAPLGTEDLNEMYRCALGGNLQGYVKAKADAVAACIEEDGATGDVIIKFSEIAKIPGFDTASVFGNSPLTYVPDLRVSFDALGNIATFSGSFESGKSKTTVTGGVTGLGTTTVELPSDYVECTHQYLNTQSFDGGHYRTCWTCGSIVDFGEHEYHEGEDECHVCGYKNTVAGTLKDGVVLPEGLKDLVVYEGKESHDYLGISGDYGYSGYGGGDVSHGEYEYDWEYNVTDGKFVVYVHLRQNGAADGCKIPVNVTVSYKEKGEVGDATVIYEKACNWHVHSLESAKMDGVGDACHDYYIQKCTECGNEYGFPREDSKHTVGVVDNGDGTVTLTCSVCHETSIAKLGEKASDYGEEGHSIYYEHVSGNPEVTFNASGLYPHSYDNNGVCTVCGYKTTRKQVVVDLSSYVGEAATITLSLDEDRGQQVYAKASTSEAIPMAARDPDSGEYHRGFGLYSNMNFIVVAEPLSMPVFDTTCDFTEFWQIAVYPVELDKESQDYVIVGEALDTYEDPWDPAEVKHHQHTHETYTPTGEGCVYDGKFVCDACGEIVSEFTISLHEISVSEENDAFRLTCEHCHESVLVGSYYTELITETYHAYRIDSEILEASSPEFEKEAMAGLFASHSFDEEGNCVCGTHREDKMTNYVWAHNISSEDPIDVAGGVHITRDEAGKATAATLYGQGKEISHNAESSFEEWSYNAVDSDGKEVGLIHEIKHYVPYEDRVVMSEHSFSLSLNGIGDNVSLYALTDYDADTPDYKTLGILIAFELSGEADDVAGRINFQYEVEEGSKMLSGISYEGVGAAIPSLTKIEQEEEEGQRIEFKAFQIVDAESNGLNYCFISEVHQHFDGEDWVEHETTYYISSFDPSNPPSDISSMDLHEVAHY